jgi:hypothetical protein
MRGIFFMRGTSDLFRRAVEKPAAMKYRNEDLREFLEKAVS